MSNENVRVGFLPLSLLLLLLWHLTTKKNSS
uniref:Uncharacterized protein n=1 Tax=Geladintestivirus 4 TaxID=3233136 RepID=A0AAU8MKQ9_9CAUD